MSDLKLIVRTADRTKKAEIVLTQQQTGADVLQSAVENWALPRDTDYSLVNDTQKKTLNPSDTLAKAGVLAGDVLEVQPVLVAGCRLCL
jgi:hypothetical protein